MIGVDLDPQRRALVVGFAATHVLDPGECEPSGLRIRKCSGGNGVDIAIDVSGADRGLQGALATAGLGATVVAAGFYQGGAVHLRLGVEFHHNSAVAHRVDRRLGRTALRRCRSGTAGASWTPALRLLHRPRLGDRAPRPGLPVRPGTRRVPVPGPAPAGAVEVACSV